MTLQPPPLNSVPLSIYKDKNNELKAKFNEVWSLYLNNITQKHNDVSNTVNQQNVKITQVVNQVTVINEQTQNVTDLSDDLETIVHMSAHIQPFLSTDDESELETLMVMAA